MDEVMLTTCQSRKLKILIIRTCIVASVLGPYAISISQTKIPTIKTAPAISIRESDTLVLSCFSELESGPWSRILSLELKGSDPEISIVLYRIRSTTWYKGKSPAPITAKKATFTATKPSIMTSLEITDFSNKPHPTSVVASQAGSLPGASTHYHRQPAHKRFRSASP